MLPITIIKRVNIHKHGLSLYFKYASTYFEGTISYSADECANIKQIVKQITAKVMKTMVNGKRNI